MLDKVGCPHKLLQFIRSFHENVKGTVIHDGAPSEPFDIPSGVKQGCVLAPTLFGIYFAVVMKHAFKASNVGIHFKTRSDGGLFRLTRLNATTLVRKGFLRDFLFADDAALVAHSQTELQDILNSFSQACSDFGLEISLQKTKVLTQNTNLPVELSIYNSRLEEVSEFVYLGSTISSNLSLDGEITKRIAKAAFTMSKLDKRVWANNLLTSRTKIQVYRACVISTLLYGSETWTPYKVQERKLNSFHMRCLRRILGVSWERKLRDEDVLDWANIPSVYALLIQKRMRWLGHVIRMDDGRIPKDLLYGALCDGKRKRGRPKLRFKDICREDLRHICIDPLSAWENTCMDRLKWRNSILKRRGRTRETATLTSPSAKRRQKSKKIRSYTN